MNKLPIKTIAICALFLASNTFGSFILIDNFSGYTTGQIIAGSNGWVGGTGGADPASGYLAMLDPTDDTNIVLDRPAGVDHGVLINSTGINIAEGSSGTLFFRFLDTDLGSNFKVGLQETGGDTTNNDTGYGAGGVTMTESSTNLLTYRQGVDWWVADKVLASNLEGTDASPTWYNLWIVANNNVGLGDTFDVYLQGGANYVAQTKVGTDLITNGLNGAIGDLKIATWNNNLNALDDFYIDSTGANLNNPTTVPEPATYAVLAALCTLGLAIIRRRK